MPEGDTIFRAARTLHSALAGRAVIGFETVFPRLSRVDVDAPLRGRTIERVTSQGKHLLIWFSGDLVLRTHMRMHGSWHIYRSGERWQRPRHAMRIAIETDPYVAVGFDVPVAEFESAATLKRAGPVQALGPDLLAADFDRAEAIQRLADRGDMDVADALLDQTAVAGIGNVYKSEILFAARVNPLRPVRSLAPADLDRILDIALRFMRANTGETAPGAIITYTGFRRTTGRTDPSERLWVYGRAGKPCRRCGTPISRRKQGPHARSTYWCERCQP